MDIDKARSLLGVVKEYDRVANLEWKTFTGSSDLAEKWMHEVFDYPCHPDDESAAQEMKESLAVAIGEAIRGYVHARCSEIRKHLKEEYGVTVEDPANGNRVLWLDEKAGASNGSAHN